MSKIVCLYVSIAIVCLLSIAPRSVLGSSCESPAEWQARIRRDAFSQIGRGFWPDEADCLHRKNMKNEGIRRRVVQVHFASTRFNKELFCGQDFYVPFGAQCFEEPQTEYNILQLTNENELNDYLSQWVERGSTTSYCEETNVKKQLVEQLRKSTANGGTVVAQEYILYTHHVPALSFCDADLTTQFINAVKALPANMDTVDSTRKYAEFVRTFGTHVINELILGGQVLKIYDDEYTFSSRGQMDLLSDTDASFEGGDSVAIEGELDVESKIETWQATVPHIPRTLHYGFAPMETFLSDQFFPEDENIDSKRENLSSFINKGRTNECTYQPVSSGPHMEIMTTDGSVFKYTIGHTFVAPEGQNIANLRILGRFQEFRNIEELYIQTDRFRISRWLDNDQVDGYRIFTEYQVLDQMPVGQWFFPQDQRDPINYVWLELFSTPEEDSILLTVDDQMDWFELEYGSDHHGYQFEHYSPFSQFRIDYVKCVPQQPIEQYDYQIKWTDYSVTFHNFGDTAVAPKNNLYMLDVALLNYDDQVNYYVFGANSDYNTYNLQNNRPQHFLRELIRNIYDDDNIVKLQTISFRVSYGDIEFVSEYEGENIVSTETDIMQFSITNSEGFNNFKITRSGSPPVPI